MDLLTKASKVSTARRSAWFVNSLDSTSTHIYDAGTTRYTEVVERKGTVKYRAVVFHRSNMSRIGVNPIVTAWELTKYSFVIDWFVDIGQWLQAISPVVGYNQLGVSLSWTVQTTDHEKSTVVGQSGWTLDAGMMDRKITRHDYTRQNYTEIPLPSYLNKLDYLKDIDLATLALQSLAGVSSTLMYAR